MAGTRKNECEQILPGASYGRRSAIVIFSVAVSLVIWDAKVNSF